MANALPRSKQLSVLSALVEGVSIRGTARMTDVSVPTILSLLVRVGLGCITLMDAMMRNLTGTRWELDEQWDFVQCKQRRVNSDHDAKVVGDQWTYLAIDPVTKLVPCFLIGKRNGANTFAFLTDFAARLANRVQISTDGLQMYVDMIPAIFGGKVDFATVVKTFEVEAAGPGRYSPPRVTAVEKTPICGAPVEEFVTTSHVERVNLTTRMQMRRMTRLTNAHSKKLENHIAATGLHFAFYNLCRIHSAIRCTPAMAANVTTTVWSMDELLTAALDAYETGKVAQ